MMVEGIREGACYLKVKRDLYYRPNNQGYTGVKEEAGRYPYDASDEQSGIAYIHEDDAPDFSPACWPEIQISVLQKTTASLQSELDARAATIEALEKRVAELEGAALVEVPVTEAVTGEEYLSLMKHGWMSGQWDADDHTLCAYYLSDMEWYPNRLFHLPKLKEPTQ